MNELALLEPFGLQLAGETDHVLIVLEYDKLKNAKARAELDSVLKRLVEKRLIEIAVMDDIQAKTKTLTLYRYNCAPPGSVLIKRPENDEHARL